MGQACGWVAIESTEAERTSDAGVGEALPYMIGRDDTHLLFLVMLLFSVAIFFDIYVPMPIDPSPLLLCCISFFRSSVDDVVGKESHCT